jgi:hypothetical protein
VLEKFNVAEIRGKYEEGNIDKNTALSLLITLIESNPDEKERVASLEAIRDITFQSERLRKILEGFLLSDANSEVRRLAAEVLVRDYLEESIDVLKWILGNERSIKCISVVLDNLILRKRDILNQFLKEFFEELLSGVIYPINGAEKYYIKKLGSLFEARGIEDSSVKDLSAIFINFRGISSLEQKYRLEDNYCEFFLKDGLVQKLEVFGLGIKRIEEIEGLSRLTHLESLNLEGNKITEISGLESLTNLKYLNLSYNLITNIKGLNTLVNLYNLRLEDNKISNLDGFKNLRNLKMLNLDNNKIDKLKPLQTLENLEYLSLSNNIISDITGLERLMNLEELNLSHNQILEIKGIKNQIHLERLFLDHNKIKKIKGLRGLRELEELDLENNQIRKIRGLKKLKNLYIIKLWENRIPEEKLSKFYSIFKKKRK